MPKLNSKTFKNTENEGRAWQQVLSSLGEERRTFQRKTRRLVITDSVRVVRAKFNVAANWKGEKSCGCNFVWELGAKRFGSAGSKLQSNLIREGLSTCLSLALMKVIALMLSLSCAAES